MSRKFFISLICLMCLCMILSFNTASADLGVEVLIYTGKIAVTSQNDVSTTYIIPQEIKALSDNTIVECIDGIAILKVGEVQVVMEVKDKLRVSFNSETGKMEMVCLIGEIEALYGESLFKMAIGQTLALNSQGIPVVEAAEGGLTPTRIGIRAKLSTEQPIMDDPEEPIYTSPGF